MAIQPIDLQAIFTQLDKVGKNQAVIREGQQIQDSLQQIQSQRKLEENVQSVNEAQDMGEEAEKIKDEKRRRPQENHGDAGERRQEEAESPGENEKMELIRDPALGRNIDISG
jgi:hypothetical protein